MDFRRRDFVRGGIAMPACNCCLLMDGVELDGSCGSGGEDWASNIETGRRRLVVAGGDLAVGDVDAAGDAG